MHPQKYMRLRPCTRASNMHASMHAAPDPGAGPKSGSPSFLGGSIGSKHLGRVQMAKRDPTQNDRFCQNAELIWAVSFRKAAI